MRKRLLCLFLCLALSGCGVSSRYNEPVIFYYLRETYQYSDSSGVISAEVREAVGHRDSLSYLLALYLMGPSEEDLRSPFPKDVRILSVEQGSTSIHLELNEAAAHLSDAELSLACACLTLTCAGLTGAEVVTVTSGARSITMTPDSLTLYDDVTPATTEETQ